MHIKIARLLLLTVLACSVRADENKEVVVSEARGKGYAFLIPFLYVVATKLFVLKIVYGAIFYALAIKGWHFLSWFIHYLKEKKHEYVEIDHGPYHHDYHHSHDHHGHEYHGHEHYGHEHYGQDNYGPYAYDKHGYGSDSGYKNYGYKKAMYDADGSYSVKS